MSRRAGLTVHMFEWVLDIRRRHNTHSTDESETGPTAKQPQSNSKGSVTFQRSKCRYLLTTQLESLPSVDVPLPFPRPSPIRLVSVADVIESTQHRSVVPAPPPLPSRRNSAPQRSSRRSSFNNKTKDPSSNGVPMHNGGSVSERAEKELREAVARTNTLAKEMLMLIQMEMSSIGRGILHKVTQVENYWRQLTQSLDGTKEEEEERHVPVSEANLSMSQNPLLSNTATLFYHLRQNRLTRMVTKVQDSHLEWTALLQLQELGIYFKISWCWMGGG